MKDIQFDFNNMMSFNIGSSDGIAEKELAQAVRIIDKAHNHLMLLIQNPINRINLGLEWTQLPFQNAQCISRIQKFGNEIAKKYENVLFLGIGGSYLGLKAAQDALRYSYYNEFASVRKGRPKIYFEGNNLDPYTLKVLLDNLNPKKTFAVVISKSGETIETRVAFEVVEAWLRKYIGKQYGRQILAITDPFSGSLRDRVNKEHSKDPLSFRSLPLLRGVGGRYSELNMGLLHLAIIGINLNVLLSGARAMARKCSENSVYKNPAYMYAALHYLLYKNKKKDIAILMPFSEGLKSTTDWYVQMLAESLGKKYERKIRVNYAGIEEWLKDKNKSVNVGRTPIAARGTNDLHSIQQNNVEGKNNKVVTFIRVEKFDVDIPIPQSAGLLSGQSFSRLLVLAQEATQWALTKENRPSCTIKLHKLTPYTWGGLIYFLEMATAFEGELLNVNAFDQPGVEGYKSYMYYKLNKSGLSKTITQEIKKRISVRKSNFII